MLIQGKVILHYWDCGAVKYTGVVQAVRRISDRRLYYYMSASRAAVSSSKNRYIKYATLTKKLLSEKYRQPLGVTRILWALSGGPVTHLWLWPDYRWYSSPRPEDDPRAILVRRVAQLNKVSNPKAKRLSRWKGKRVPPRISNTMRKK